MVTGWILGAESSPWSVWVPLLVAGVAALSGLAQVLSQRRKNDSSAAKDIADASKVARQDLVDEVARLDKRCDTLQTLVNSLGDSLAAERARSKAIQDELDAERRYTTRLAGALRDAGLDVPLKDGTA